MSRTPEQRRATLIAKGYDPAKVAALAMDPDGPRYVRQPYETAEPYAPEYEGERLTAAQLGVGRFHDGRGL